MSPSPDSVPTDGDPVTIRVIPWPDATIDRLGFAAHSAYVEWCWLPRIGPSGTWAYRRLVGGFETSPEGYDLDLVELARSLGLGTGVSRNAPVSRTLGRLCAFGLATAPAERTIAVRRKAPPLTARQLERLTPRLKRVHASLMARHQAAPPA
jgi:hypothetical protein